ncbi:MAG: sensor domain-containing protein [Candidatus Krumholzibacteria bacterium]|nr:sensor domain-containing protein [Candidatus Krumholzibacteria bacterium]
MSKTVEDYLEQLRRELAGADPATVQDALSDAEEHLRTALDQTLGERPDVGEAEALEQICEAYGAPADIAEAYREIESHTPPPLAPPERRAGPSPRASLGPPHAASSFVGRFFGVFIDPRAYASLFYMLFSLFTGIIYFTWAITGISLSLGLIILIIGLPFVAVFLLSVQGIALVEGRIVEALLGVRMPRRPLFSGRHLGLWSRFKVLLTDKLSWTTMAYMIIQFPLGILYFTIFVTMLCLGLAGIAQPILHFGFGLPFAQIDNREIFLPSWMIPLCVAVGILWILVTMHAAKFIGRLHGSIAKSLLVRD